MPVYQNIGQLSSQIKYSLNKFVFLMLNDMQEILIKYMQESDLEIGTFIKYLKKKIFVGTDYIQGYLFIDTHAIQLNESQEAVFDYTSNKLISWSRYAFTFDSKDGLYSQGDEQINGKDIAWWMVDWIEFGGSGYKGNQPIQGVNMFARAYNELCSIWKNLILKNLTIAGISQLYPVLKSKLQLKIVHNNVAFIKEF